MEKSSGVAAVSSNTNETKSWTMTKKILTFGPVVGWFLTLVISAVFPALVLIPTILLFVFCLQVLYWSVPSLFKEVIRCEDDEDVGAIFSSALTSVFCLIAIYFSHDIVQFLSSCMRYVVVELPCVLYQALLAIWDFIVGYIHHGLWGF